MVRIGSFVRVTRDALRDEPVVAGMVGKVVRDLYNRIDPDTEAMVLMAGARKPCAVPLEAVELISETDHGEEAPEARRLWRDRRKLWKKRHGSAPPPSGEEAPEHEPDESEADELPEVPSSPRVEPVVDAAELLKRADAVQPQEISGLASPAMLGILTEWSVGALDVLADNIPSFGKLPYARARDVRTEHVERWLWDGVRLYLAVRSLHPALLPAHPEPSRERIRALFDRIDEGEAAERLAAFSVNVVAVKQALSALAAHWVAKALKDFAKEIESQEPPVRELERYVLQLHIVGYQVAFCTDSANHGIPAH